MKLSQPMILSFLMAAALLLPPPRATAQDADKVTSILTAMRQASGGDHWEEIRSLHTVMSMSAGGQAVRAESWEDVVTGRYMDRYVRSNFTSQDGYDGVTSWRQSRSGIAYTLGDVDSALVTADEAFRVSRGWWFPERHPATIRFAGIRNENGRSFEVLDITPEGGRMFEAWIDQATHLLARTDEQQAEERVVTTYSDYRLKHGVVLPFTIRSSDGGDPAFDDVATVQSIEMNPDTNDALYSVPPLPGSDIVLPAQRDSVEVPFRLTADNRILVPLTVDGHRAFDAPSSTAGAA
jgi:hypothetical protein